MLAKKTLKQYAHLLPIILATYSLMMCFGVNKTIYQAMAAVFGVLIGFFALHALVQFLESGDQKQLGLKAGFSIGLATVATYPFYIVYKLFQGVLLPETMRTIGFLLFIALIAVLIFSKPKLNPEQPRLANKAVIGKGAKGLLVVLALLFCLSQVLNSGVLEKQGGTEQVIGLYLFNVVMRIPFAMLLGYYFDKPKRAVMMAIPVSIMLLGCVATLFFQNTELADKMIFLLLNFGGKGCVFLVHIIGMMIAITKNNKGLYAGTGIFLYFFSKGYLNLSALRLDVDVFAQSFQFELTLLVCLCAIPFYLLLIGWPSQPNEGK